MSGFSSAALPGRIPTSGPGRNITPESLFARNPAAIDALVSDRMELPIKSVKVRIFDLSDDKQRKDYEKLWAKLLVMVSKAEAMVDSHKDLVRRADGTSYWMKYVEYVELDTSGNSNKTGGAR